MATAVAQSLSSQNILFNYSTSGSDQDEEQNELEAEEPGGIEERGEEPNNKKDEFERLKSYPFQWECNIEKRELTKSGFYFVKPAGGFTHSCDYRVKCAFCAKVINLTTLQATLQDEHRKLSPECEILSGNSRTNVPLCDVTAFRFEKHRLISFLVTNWVSPVDPYDLAEWGFYYTGVGDNVRCTFCRLEVREWEDGDTGEAEHRRWHPLCGFLNNRAVGNVKLGQEEQASTIVCCPFHDITGKRNNNTAVIERLQFPGEKPTDINLSELNVNTIENVPRARHPNYRSMQSRLESYSTWPNSLRQRPQQLAEAGFYYTGTGDRVICFHCGGGLKDWEETDDPWTEHTAWFPSCDFLKQMKGQQFINNRGEDEREEETPTSNSEEQTTVQQSTLQEVPMPAAATFNEPAPVNLHVIDSRLCIQCNNNELGIVYLPCGHMVSCPECAAKTTDTSVCQACKKKINAYVRAYLP